MEQIIAGRRSQLALWEGMKANSNAKERSPIPLTYFAARWKRMIRVRESTSDRSNESRPELLALGKINLEVMIRHDQITR